MVRPVVQVSAFMNIVTGPMAAAATCQIINDAIAPSRMHALGHIIVGCLRIPPFDSSVPSLLDAEGRKAAIDR